jgi:hypothetical protein
LLHVCPHRMAGIANHPGWLVVAIEKLHHITHMLTLVHLFTCAPSTRMHNRDIRDKYYAKLPTNNQLRAKYCAEKTIPNWTEWKMWLISKNSLLLSLSMFNICKRRGLNMTLPQSWTSCSLSNLF